MASIYKRKNKNGTTTWRAVIRIKGYPSVSNHFDRKQAAEDWAAETERNIKRGNHSFNTTQNTFIDLVDRFIQDGALQYHKSQKDTGVVAKVVF